LKQITRLEDPPIQSIIDAKLVPRMIEFMQVEDEPKLQVTVLRVSNSQIVGESWKQLGF